MAVTRPAAPGRCPSWRAARGRRDPGRIRRRAWGRPGRAAPRSESMPTRIDSRRSLSAAVTSRGAVRGLGLGEVDCPGRRSTWCTPAFIRNSSMSVRVDSTRPLGVGDAGRPRSRSSRAATIPARSSTGTVSEATSAVDTPRLPIPFSAATCRLRGLVDEAVRERLVVLTRCDRRPPPSRSRPGTSPARRSTGACPRG